MRFLRVLPSTLILVITNGFAADWPQWRGPNGDNVCNETGLLETFPPDGLKIRWHAPAGWGFSSPINAQGRVYLIDSELQKPKAKERVRCFDEATGEVKWSHTYDLTVEDWAFDSKQEFGPVATPIVRDGKLYTLGRCNHLSCLDAAKGDVLWQKNLLTDYQAPLSAGAPSPLIDGEKLILFIGGKPGACVIALNKDSGKEIWKKSNDSLTFSSPIIISSGGKRQLIVWTKESVLSLDPETGTNYWRIPLETNSDYAVATPILFKDRLLVGGMMLQLDSEKPGAKIVWPEGKAPTKRVFSNTSTALFNGDHIYTVNMTGGLICVEATTGKKVWESADVTTQKGGASIHIAENGNSCLLFTDKGELIRAKLSIEGYKEISRTVLIEPTLPFGGRNVVWPPPAYANGHIFVRSGKELICASLASEK